MFLIRVDPNPLKARVELASCYLVEAACSGSNFDLYLDEAGWHLNWAIKLMYSEAHPDPLAIAALSELLPLYHSMCGPTSAETMAPETVAQP